MKTKKILYSVFALAIAAFTFTACEDVPEPYEIPGQDGAGSVTVTEPAGEGSLGSPFNVAGVLNHLQNSEDISAKVYVKGKISQIKEVDYSNFGNATFWISDDGTTNNQFYVYRCFSLNNEKFKSADEIKVGDEVVIYGNVTIYNGTYETTANAAYIYSLNGQTSGNAGGGSETPVEGVNLLTNGDFEAWTGGQPDNWQSASSASKCTLSQSTDAHGGSYSVKVATASSNQRLAYKELTLKAGTYTMQFYAKAMAEGGQVNPGYVPVTDGSVGSYVYGGYVTVSTDEWQLVSNTFTLTTETVVCLVVMNPSNRASDILIDDFSLMTSDGGVSGGNQDDNGNAGQPAGDTATIPYSIDFLSSQAGWTTNDVKLASGKTYVWYTSAQYGYCASAGAKEDAEGWLISPSFDLSKLSSATMKISHAGNYFGTMSNEATVWASTDGGSNWSKLTVSNYPTGWSFVDATIDLSSVAGKSNVKIGFKYISSTAAYGTWEIKTVSIN